ncbi:50S ribosomal protein L35 [Patescibacteria group bacterium]|nr:50S ribosomal protein L35 [Patescibacteria group bacterium]
MKLKTHKGLSKRIKISKGGKGKLRMGHINTSHLKTKQSAKKKRRKKGLTDMSKPDAKRLKVLLPYG